VASRLPSSGPRAPAETRQRKRCTLIIVSEPLPEDWWTTSDVARFLGISPSTVRAYVAREQMPKADRRIGREPVWRPATIR
jgi:transcriptional regulator with XRE-family HTH domain